MDCLDQDAGGGGGGGGLYVPSAPMYSIRLIVCFLPITCIVM